MKFTFLLNQPKKNLICILIFIANLSHFNLKLKMESFSLSNMAINLINLAANAVVPRKHYINFIHLIYSLTWSKILMAIIH